MRATESKSRSTVVCGGAGFIGSHLCERLLAEGHTVWCVDDLAAGSRRNVAHLLAEPRFRLLEQDAAQPLPTSIDRIYDLNLACDLRHAPHAGLAGLPSFEPGLLGTINALETALASGARLLHASVAAAGARQEEELQAGRDAETLVTVYKRRERVDARIARIFDPYGPRMPWAPGGLLSTFIVRTLRGAELTILGRGAESCRPCHVDDIVTGLMLLMEGEDPGEPVDLANPDAVPVLELAEAIARVCEVPLCVRFAAAPGAPVPAATPDLRIAREQLGFTPRVGLLEGLEQTILDFAWRIRSERAARIAGRLQAAAHRERARAARRRLCGRGS
jgi:UDP-glucuronate decarboxylase